MIPWSGRRPAWESCWAWTSAPVFSDKIDRLADNPGTGCRESSSSAPFARCPNDVRRSLPGRVPARAGLRLPDVAAPRHVAVGGRGPGAGGVPRAAPILDRLRPGPSDTALPVRHRIPDRVGSPAQAQPRGGVRDRRAGRRGAVARRGAAVQAGARDGAGGAGADPAAEARGAGDARPRRRSQSAR